MLTTAQHLGIYFLAFIVSLILLEPTRADELADGHADYASDDGPLTFCGDSAEWPPYMYFKRDRGQKTNQIVGFDIDVVREIFNKHGIKTRFDLLPWQQCLQEARQNKQYQVVMSSSYNKERTRDFLLSISYYSLHHYFFYDRSRFPGGLHLTLAKDIYNHGKVCGIHGYNYEGTGVLKNAKINRGAKNFQGLVDKLLGGHCAAFVARKEIIDGFSLLNLPMPHEDKIGFEPVPHARTDKFHYLVSKKHPKARSIQKILNEGIDDLKRSGRLMELFDQYTKKLSGAAQ